MNVDSSKTVHSLFATKAEEDAFFESLGPLHPNTPGAPEPMDEMYQFYPELFDTFAEERAFFQELLEDSVYTRDETHMEQHNPHHQTHANEGTWTSRFRTSLEQGALRGFLTHVHRTAEVELDEAGRKFKYWQQKLRESARGLDGLCPEAQREIVKILHSQMVDNHT